MSNSYLFYKEILGIYKSSANKDENKMFIIKQLLKRFQEEPDNYELRVLMETQFMHDIKYNYMFIVTPDNAGCDLRELVFNIANESDRTAILAAINKTKPSALIPHILTDIDDTIYPNFTGIIETSGSDISWKNGQTYPGLKKLYELFYKNITLPEARYSTVLSGTPVFLKEYRIKSNIIRDSIGSKFGFIQGFDKKREALSALIQGMHEQAFYKIAVSKNRLADIKYEKFKQYRQLYPEYKLLFIGDNGQGDLLAGLKMIKTDPTCQVFIHNVLRTDGFVMSDEEVKTATSDRLFFFKNYLEIGYFFYKLGYISLADYNELRANISKELVQVRDINHRFHYKPHIDLQNPRKTSKFLKKNNRTRRILNKTKSE